MATPIECAFHFGEYTADDGGKRWHARVTVKCPTCGRRTSQLQQGLGTLAEALPLTVKCKNNHDTLVIPYRYPEGFTSAPSA
jgi:hypothetical protein